MAAWAWGLVWHVAAEARERTNRTPSDNLLMSIPRARLLAPLDARRNEP